jgi:hypothetical protein
MALLQFLAYSEEHRAFSVGQGLRQRVEIISITPFNSISDHIEAELRARDCHVEQIGFARCPYPRTGTHQSGRGAEYKEHDLCLFALERMYGAAFDTRKASAFDSGRAGGFYPVFADS